MGTHRNYLEIAMEEAECAYKNNTYPVGAVIVGPDGHVISRAHNHVYSEGDFTGHAEVEAIRRAGSGLMQKGNFENCTLYTTWEPCLMCCGAILLARIKRVIWVMDDNIHGGLRLLHKNKRLRSLYVNLEISPTNEDDLVRRMEVWMDEWNEKKETVVSDWRQKDKPIQPSLV